MMLADTFHWFTMGSFLPCREEHKKHSPNCLFLTLKKKAEEMSLSEFLKLDKERVKMKMVSKDN